MNCNNIREELVAYIDDELSLMGRHAIEAHLAECQECATECEQLRKVSQWTHQVVSIQPAPGWWEKLQERMYASDPGANLSSELRALREAIGRIESRMKHYLSQYAQAKEIMTLEEVAAYLRIDTETVWNLIDEIPHFEVGYELRFRKSSVDEWIRMKENGSQRDSFRWDMPMSWLLERFTPLGQ